MRSYQLEPDNRFVVSDFQNQRPFSSTLPGIAGTMGIPMWVFYVNRGQGITSFGVENKDHPIMEFQPANKAYQLTPFLGFRTFIKVLSSDEPRFYEPFAAGSGNAEQQMIVSLSELELRDQSLARGLRVEVLYFVLPQEKVAGLVRQLRVINLASVPQDLEILDGLPVVNPYGVSNKDLKEHNRTIEALMEVYNQERDTPFFRLRSTAGDTAEVSPIEEGNFAQASAIQGGISHRLPAIVDPSMIFGPDTSLSHPANFERASLASLLQLPQHGSGKTPCAFFGHSTTLNSGEAVTLYSVFGHASQLESLNELSPRLTEESYLRERLKISRVLTSELVAPIDTRTGNPIFDAYCRQTFLDNVLRGGWPVQLGHSDKPVTYHVYSRKHGDPERDYNAFFMAAEFYSQGNGNYRDVNQNRRCEILFDPRVFDTNVWSFMSLIQADGYNPLDVKGSRFWIPPEKHPVVLERVNQPDRLKPVLQKPFTPGSLLKDLENREIRPLVTVGEFLQLALDAADRCFDAEFGEGYWIDHWTYNLDLIDCFLAVYPERATALLFGRDDLPFFESPVFVQPRSKKYVLVDGQPRQYGAVIGDDEKAALIASRREYPNLMRYENGQGGVFRTTLYAKLTLLAVVKFATMDPLGMGVEMEAGRPGWCDALNGLPGLFGSSMSETFELARLLDFLLGHLPDGQADPVSLPIELFELLVKVTASLRALIAGEDEGRDFRYWDGVSVVREDYRQITRLGFDGRTVPVSRVELAEYLRLFQDKVQAGIARALQMNGGIPPTYFTYDMVGYEILYGSDGKALVDDQQRPLIRALRFSPRVLPVFLEGPVHMLKTLRDSQAARQLYQRVRDSALYDHALKMYKTNASLDGQSMEIGRLRAFTPGWLENESVFLHMEYKYLLELLRAGLYDEYFEDLRNALVAFQDPATYGRSPLENSSFIVSSAHPDKGLHGAGYVARLTGATAEFLSMWNLMMVGPNPFFIDNGEFCLRLRPALPDWLFDESGALSFTFLGHCRVTYHNPQRQHAYPDRLPVQRLTLQLDGRTIDFEGAIVRSPYSLLVRDLRINRIDAFLSE